MKKILFIFFVLFSVHIALGQDDGSTQEPNKFEKFLQNEKVGVLVDYFGELVLHPGMAIGIDYSISKNGWFDLHWTTEVGGYYHKWNHTGLFAKTSIGTRYTTSFSWFMDLNVGAGYLHTIPEGDVYRLNDDGIAEKAPNWGKPHFMPAASLLFGFDGGHRQNLPFSVHFGVEAFMESSFNHLFLPHAACRAGIIYKFKVL